MQLRDHYLPGVPCWVDTTQPDPDAAIDFYGELFGWTFDHRTPPQAPVQFWMAQLDGHDVGGITTPMPDSDGPARWNTYVAVESVEQSLARVVELGGAVTWGPLTVPKVGTDAECTDPSGAAFLLWETHGRNGAQVVNASSSWNWSNLHTDDPATAIDFYGPLFGWVPTELQMGDTSATMLTRPGYGDDLLAHDPELRERHAQGQVPPGFSDAIGWLETGDGEPPRWEVAFAVDDVEEIAERAVKLGATIHADPMPYAAGAAEIVVLHDPQGARFTASHYSG